MNRGQGRTHGVASTYPFCHDGPDGKACRPCRNAHADKNAGQRFRGRRRRIASARIGAMLPGNKSRGHTLGVASRSPKGAVSRPATDHSVGRRDALRADLYQMIGLINEGKAPRFTEDHNGDMAIMAELLDEYIAQDPDSGAMLCSRFCDDGSLVLWEDENA